VNKNKLTALCHKVCAETELPFNSVLTCYFLENILERISNSSFCQQFVFKGGFLLSNIVGLKTRSTMDIDFSLRNAELSETAVRRMFTEILVQNDDDDSICKLSKIERIRDEDEYGGLRVTIECTLENIRMTLPIDIATGDVMTPEPIPYVFRSYFEQKDITLAAYSLETMMAEKLQTLYARGFLNSRSKDFYDLYILFMLKKDSLNKKTLREACGRTFTYRKTEFSLEKISVLVQNLVQDKTFESRWNAYVKKNQYASGIQYAQIMQTINNLVLWIEQ
jgi:predicted nucleotidyltransferase component of viral defense system